MVGVFFALVGAMVAAQACHGPNSEECRFDPDCGGGLGGTCDKDRDCFEGFCCDSDNCGGGMCTLDCDGDRDCPDGMRCEHDICFFACDSDRDCAAGAQCEHGNTVCEWD